MTTAPAPWTAQGRHNFLFKQKMLSGFPWIPPYVPTGKHYSIFAKRLLYLLAGEPFVLRLNCLCIPQGSGAGKPETKIVVPVVRIVVVPIGRTSVRR